MIKFLRIFLIICFVCATNNLVLAQASTSAVKPTDILTKDIAMLKLGMSKINVDNFMRNGHYRIGESFAEGGTVYLDKTEQLGIINGYYVDPTHKASYELNFTPICLVVTDNTILDRYFEQISNSSQVRFRTQPGQFLTSIRYNKVFDRDLSGSEMNDLMNKMINKYGKPSHINRTPEQIAIIYNSLTPEEEKMVKKVEYGKIPFLPMVGLANGGTHDNMYGEKGVCADYYPYTYNYNPNSFIHGASYKKEHNITSEKLGIYNTVGRVNLDYLHRPTLEIYIDKGSIDFRAKWERLAIEKAYSYRNKLYKEFSLKPKSNINLYWVWGRGIIHKSTNCRFIDVSKT